MRIEIEIPKKFEEHFNQDKFKDSFERIMADIKHSLENGNCLCAGRYEHEIIEMLEKAFENSKSAYSVDKVVEELEEMIHPKQLYFCKYARGGCKHLYNNDKDCMECIVENAIEIVKQGAVSDDVCEWKIKDACYTSSIKHYDALPTPIVKAFVYCPYCGKKIKVV